MVQELDTQLEGSHEAHQVARSGLGDILMELEVHTVEALEELHNLVALEDKVGVLLVLHTEHPAGPVEEGNVPVQGRHKAQLVEGLVEDDLPVEHHTLVVAEAKVLLVECC